MNQVLTVLPITGIAKRYGLAPSAVRRLVASGAVPSKRVGLKYLIRVTDFEEWLAGDGDVPSYKDLRRLKGE